MSKKYEWMKKDIKSIEDVNPNNPQRKAEMLKEYEEKGWTQMDIWSLDITIARFIVPRLKFFKECHDYSKSKIPNKVEKNNPKMTEKEQIDEWSIILGKMLAAFELIADEKGIFPPTKEHKAVIDEGLDLFREHYFCLWN